jgi:hypothetical protein
VENRLRRTNQNSQAQARTGSMPLQWKRLNEKMVGLGVIGDNLINIGRALPVIIPPFVVRSPRLLALPGIPDHSGKSTCALESS